jgi:hypothetical protein
MISGVVLVRQSTVSSYPEDGEILELTQKLIQKLHPFPCSSR